VYEVLGGILKDEGVLQLEDFEIKDVDSLKEGIVKQAEAIHEEWKNNLDPKLKHLIDNFEDGVPFDQLIDIKSNEIRYSGITEDRLEENVDVQKAVYAEYLRTTTKFSETKIAKEVDKAADLDELFDNAKEGLEALKEVEKEREAELVEQTKAQKVAQAKAQKEYVENIEKVVKETKEIVPGVAISDKERKEVQKYMTTPVAFDKQGNPISKIQEIQAKDPIKFNMMLNYFAAKGFFEGKFDTITTRVKTDVLNKLEKSVESQANKMMAGKNNINTSSKTEALVASLEMFKKK
jgi:hypothetical protein